MYKYKAGFVGFGEVNTPIEVVRKKCEDARKLLNDSGVELVGMDAITDDERGEDAKKAIEVLKKEDFDYLIVCITGWIPSHTVITVINEFKEKPMLLWGLGGSTSEGRLQTTAAQAGTTALRKPMEDMGFNFKYVYDFPDSPSNIEEVMNFVKAASTVAKLKRGKVGMMGYRDMRLYGTLYDGVSLRGKIGTEVEFFEMLEIVQKMEDVKKEEIDAIINKVKTEWVFEKEAKAETLEMGAKVYLALKDRIEEGGYDAVSLIDVDGMKKLLKFPPSMVFMLIANEMGLSTVPENDTMGAVTQLVTRYATDQISAYLEFYEFMPDRLLAGVPDYVPKEIIDGPLKVCPTSFGLLSEGILNVSKIKTGKVTLARLGYKGDKYIMHMITGEAVDPRSWEEVGWTPPAPQLPSLEIIPDTPVKDFGQKVMGQHYILTYGDNTGVLTDICNLLDIEII